MKKIVVLEGKGFLYDSGETLFEALVCLKFLDILQSMPWEGKKHLGDILRRPGFQFYIIKLEGVEKKNTYLIKAAGKRGMTVLSLPQVEGRQSKKAWYVMVSKMDRCRFEKLLGSRRFKRYAWSAEEVSVFEYMGMLLPWKRKARKAENEK